MSDHEKCVKRENKSRRNTGHKEPIDWKAIREQIVSNLKGRFVELYKSWGVKFTRANGTKAECHAIDREDNRASAVVFLDNGRYHDSGGGKDCDPFDLMILCGRAADSRDALEKLAKESRVQLPTSRSANSPRPASPPLAQRGG